MLLRDAARRRSASTGVRLRLGSLGTPETRAALPRAAHRLPARARGPAAARRRASASTSTRCARSTPTTRGTRRSWRDAPKLLDELSPDDAEHFAEVRRLLDAVELAVRGRPDARARPRLLHAHGVRVHLRRARRAERRRRRRALRRPGRAARRPADARHRLGGGRRADAARRRRRPRAPSRPSTSSSPTSSRRRARRRSS